MPRFQFLTFLILFQYITGQEVCPCASFDAIEKQCLVYNSKLTCNPEKRIIGGFPTDIKRWPYIISLQIAAKAKGPGCYSHMCAGALIAPNLVLSAAHCYDNYMNGLKEGPLKFQVYAAQVPSCRHLGNSRGVGTGFRSQVDYVHLLPQWDRSTATGDLAILVLNETLPGPYVKIQSEVFAPSTQQAVTIAGYGSVDPEENANLTLYNMRQLYEAKLSYISEFLCGFLADEFQAGVSARLNSNSMFCAYNQASDTCKGDSGGPAVLKGASPDEDVLVGVTSWGPFTQCTSRDRGQAPGIFARVGLYTNFSQLAEDALANTDGNVILKPEIP
eukprot:TRINITY_DN2835_c0_g2_i5.p1 TRINITY_DN2835_c0_g2~~TRINITY_DN2835_c0_g2_i5.p1  ORF type:complete len:331 (+),score=41.07 TRINITY_DN2835_c0_g2_i5:163-1155(+)